MLGSILFIVLILCGCTLTPPTLMWWHDFKLCKDVTKCNKCPIHGLHNTEIYCKDSGKTCKDVHFCSTRKWL
jgi:hypothetical protein